MKRRVSIVARWLVIAALVAGIAGVSVPFTNAATNMLQNGGLETTIAPNTWNLDAQSSRQNNNARAGSYSLRIGMGAGGAYQDVTTGVSELSIYTITGWGKVSAAGEKGWLVYQTFNASGTKLSDNSISFDMTSYTVNSTSFRTPAGTTRIRIYLWKDAGVGGYFYADEVSLYAGLSETGGFGNVVEDSNFERHDPEWGSDTATASYDNTNPYSGFWGLKIGPGFGWRGQSHDLESLVPGSKYTLSARGKVTSSTDPGKVEAKLYDGTGALIATYLLPDFTSTSYTLKELSFVAPDNIGSIVVGAWKNSGSGTFYVDDLYLVGMTAPNPAIMPPPTPAAPVANYLKNGDLEAGTTTGWSNVSGASAVNGQGAAGTAYGLQVGSGGTVDQSLELSGAPSYAPLVLPDTYYKIGAYGKLSASGAAGYVKARIYDFDNVLLDTKTLTWTTETAYTLKELAFVTPERASRINVAVSHDTGSNTFYADEIKLTPGTGNVVIDVSDVQNDFGAGHNPIGVNLSLFGDTDAVRSKGVGLQATLADMGVGSLRYPGGEKSDAIKWADAPYTTPSTSPKLIRSGPLEWPGADRTVYNANGTQVDNPMDFNEYVAMTGSLGAKRNIVLAYDSQYMPASWNGSVSMTGAQLLDMAKGWVQYAKSNNIPVDFWEVGNEVWNNSYAGWARAADYAADLNTWVPALKAIDPAMKVAVDFQSKSKVSVIDFDGSKFAQTVLQNASDRIDYAVMHMYPPYQFSGYNYYRYNTFNFIRDLWSQKSAVNAYAKSQADKDRIKYVVTEFAVYDWKPGWANANDTGHAVATVDFIGQMLREDKVHTIQYWNTRFRYQKDPGAEPYSTFYLVDENNQLTPTGKAVKAWSKYVHRQMVKTVSPSPTPAYTSLDPATGNLSVYLVNKESTAIIRTIQIQNSAKTLTTGERYVLKGTSPDDTATTFTQGTNVSVSGNTVTVTLDPYSATLLTLH